MAQSVPPQNTILPLGHSRAVVERNYALISPDSHVTPPLAGWKNTKATIHISPAMGAQFTQYTALLDADAVSDLPGTGIERFFYVAAGQLTLSADEEYKLSTGDYAFIPSDSNHEIRTAASSEAKLIVFEKQYQPRNGVAFPPMIVGRSAEVLGEPYQGDDAARLQTLLPVTPQFDLAVNIFTYQPGARLPQVEVHVMEHGLCMLSGEGIYRLGDSWYPVQAGDIIWMGPYCPQWFVAMGKTPASYIFYKNIHRHRLTD